MVNLGLYETNFTKSDFHYVLKFCCKLLCKNTAIPLLQPKDSQKTWLCPIRGGFKKEETLWIRHPMVLGLSVVTGQLSSALVCALRNQLVSNQRFVSHSSLTPWIPSWWERTSITDSRISILSLMLSLILFWCVSWMDLSSIDVQLHLAS